MFSEYEVRKMICEVGRRIYQKDFIAANDGNISVKINDKEVICTPTGVSKGFMTPDMLIKVNMEGEVIQGNGNFRPSSEIKMHLRVYKKRPDVKSVVHAHPPYATGFAVVGKELRAPILPEAVIALGWVPIAEYGTPSTDEIPDAVEKYLNNYDALLLENHGALTYGSDLMNAYFKMESLEYYAKLMFITTQLGGPKCLNSEQCDKLIDLRRQMNIPGRHPGDMCKGGDCSCSDTKKEEPKAMDDIVSEITKRVISKLNI